MSASTFRDFLPPTFDSIVRDWLSEDISSFDFGGYVVGSESKKATLYQKQRGVMAGKPFVDAVFKHCDCNVTWLGEEGTYHDSAEKLAVAKVEGPINRLLTGERLALNIIQRASAIATACRRARQIAEEKQWGGIVAVTRKSTPGFRMVQKYAAVVGGCDAHRYNLSSMVMLKDNHIKATGSITGAVKKARSVAGFSLKIEVECASFENADEALRAGADIVMLDNFTPEAALEVSERLKAAHPHAVVEVSGGVTFDTIASYMGEHVDVISMGNLIQQAGCIDFSLKVD